MMIRLPAVERLAEPGALIDSLPPGAQAPSHGALLSPSLSRSPVPPKQVQPSPGAASSSRLGLGDLVGRDA